MHQPLGFFPRAPKLWHQLPVELRRIRQDADVNLSRLEAAYGHENS